MGFGDGNVVDPIDFGTFTTPTGGVAVTRESVTHGGVTKQGYYKIGAATDLWIRVSGKLSGAASAKVIGCWRASKPTDPYTQCALASQRVFTVESQVVGGSNVFDASGWVYNLPANSYIWVYAEKSGKGALQTTKTLTEHRLQLDFDRGQDRAQRPAQRHDLRTPGPRQERSAAGAPGVPPSRARRARRRRRRSTRCRRTPRWI